MSRIWKLPIEIVDWVEISIKDNKITVKWPKWELNYSYPYWVKVEKEEKLLKVSVISDNYKNLWWLVRTLVFNMIEWVTKWFEKKLLILWVWFNWKSQWQKLTLNLWFSHQIMYEVPSELKLDMEKTPKWEDVIIISGIDKQKVWEVAAKIRNFRKPEVYKGKWIRYIDEYVKLKPWKAAAKK